jgi:hypothetical protein
MSVIIAGSGRAKLPLHNGLGTPFFVPPFLSEERECHGIFFTWPRDQLSVTNNPEISQDSILIHMVISQLHKFHHAMSGDQFGES